MGSEIELINDGDGLAVIGDPTAVEYFLASEGLASRDLGLHRLRPMLGTAAGVAQAASVVAASSGRWMKLSEESAKIAQKYPMVKNLATGNAHATLRAENGQFVKNLQFVQGHGSILTNPAVLAGAAGIMAQIAMQQAMDEITDYLATIDEKVDDVLRAQKDAVLADMIGVAFAIEEAMTIREQVGRVSDVTWSKVQATPTTIARTQAYVLRQLDALAEKLEHKSDVGDLAKASGAAESKVQEWLAVLARCFQLQDAIAILELDRVLDTSPAELDQHRLALRAARQNRLELISRSTTHLLARMDAAAGTANTKVLLHPIASRTVVNSTNHVAVAVGDFHGRLGIDRDRETLEARRWVDAAVDARDGVLEAGADGVDAAMRFGNETVGRAKSVTDKFSSRIAERTRRLRGDDQVLDGEDDRNAEQSPTADPMDLPIRRDQ
jgi:rRNA processing protein Krr1/Pno1